MPILRIKVVDASGLAMAGQTVKVSHNGQLQSNADGIAQFLLGEPAHVDIEINGSAAWAGSSDQLAREERFQQGAAGFSRAS